MGCWGGTLFDVPSLSAEETTTGRSRMLRHLASAEEYLHNAGFSTEHLRTLLMVGTHAANGHAYLDRKGAVAWFAIECFHGKMDTKVFTMHELIHALHYEARPEFAFTTIKKKNLVWRQLITEGIATYLTKHLLNITDEAALWADAIRAKQIQRWMAACRIAEKELFRLVGDTFESSDPSIALFSAANPEDIFSYRAGYYVGLTTIESIASENNFSVYDLLHLPSQDLKRLVWNHIQSRN